jgi:cyanophycin synthetase
LTGEAPDPVLHTNQRLVVEELRRRGAEVVPVEPGIELMEVRLGGRRDYLLDRFSAAAPYHMVKASADKRLTKSLLHRGGVAAPEGERFDGESIDAALAHADALGYPVVAKPNWGSHGDGVRTGIPDRARLEACLWQFVAERGPREPFLVERHLPFSEHRVFATRAGGFAVVRRDPASVLGDGVSSVAELAERESARRIALRAAGPTSLCPIALDREAHDHLMRTGRGEGFGHVPEPQERVPLRLTSNLAKGGVAVEVTHTAHPSVRTLAERVLSILNGLPVVGIDLLCADVTAPLAPGNHGVIEVNSNPGLAMHHHPGQGPPRDVAAMVVDAMFPWIPAVPRPVRPGPSPVMAW